MKTFKLILKSLISNNACIDGGRKKPWYFAAIMFFLAMIFAILPLFVQTLNTNGDDAFKTYAYGADQATLRFNEYLNENEIKIYVKKSVGEEGSNIIVAEKFTGQPVDNGAVDYKHEIPVKDSEGGYTNQIDFIFAYRSQTPSTDEELSAIVGPEQKTSFMIFTQDQILIHLVNFETKGAIQNIACRNAAKYLEEGRSINELLSPKENPTEKVNETFNNWKLFIRDAYKFTRLTATWQTCAIMGGINVGVTLLMGFLVWILTRGKRNPYHEMFGLWNTQKSAWWATITPSLLALGFGFLIPRFANILFPMLIGIRVMWLSLKSLRPDGSGYSETYEN